RVSSPACCQDDAGPAWSFGPSCQPPSCQPPPGPPPGSSQPPGPPPPSFQPAPPSSSQPPGPGASSGRPRQGGEGSSRHGSLGGSGGQALDMAVGGGVSYQASPPWGPPVAGDPT